MLISKLWIGSKRLRLIMSRESKKNCFTTTEEEEEEFLLFFKCAEIVLPWLSPSDLASISSTCKTLHHISKSITIRRASDASRNFEKHPIPFINTIDTQPYFYFIYTPSQILGFLPSSSSSSQIWGSNSNNHPQKPTSSLISVTVGSSSSSCGCVCEDCSEENDGCPCELLSGSDIESEMMTECGMSCGCGMECENRLTQRGVSVRLRIVKDEKKGWGLYAAQFVHCGEFICEYAGELLTTQEAQRRQQNYDKLASTTKFSSALLVVREHLPSRNACFRINIDATRIGNIARFINHSCDGGNLTSVLVRNSGALLPRLCFFASRDILEGEELAFSYGDVRLKQNGLKCFCGSSGCYGTLPSEQT